MNPSSVPSLELPNHTVHELSADLVIVGGGLAGVSAAVSASRLGTSVILIQDRSMLGGNASSEIKMHIVGADCHGRKPGCRESGFIEELRLEDSYRNPHRSYSQWDLLLYEKVKLEPNITLLLDTTCTSTETNPETGEITSITALRNPTEDIYLIKGRFFADCSGDSRMSVDAGADYQVGRESTEEFGESLAQPVGDRHTLGSSILITGRKYDTPQPFHAPKWVRKFTKDDLYHRPISSYEYGYWWFEWGGQFDTIKDNEKIRHELLRIALGIWDFVKNSGNYPDASHWALDWVGSIPGKRESRRLRGPHVLTQHDVLGGKIFPDAVAYGGWAIDLHPPSGVDVPNEPPFTPTGFKHLYTIPMRSLLSRNVPNLLCAGRNISATHVAFASTRVMATCSVMGQAVGTAAALAAQAGAPLLAFTEGEPLVKLQQQLLKDDAYIPTIRNSDPADLALQAASITASTSTSGCEPALVIDGTTRDLVETFGPWSDGKSHHWSSSELPACLEITFDAPREIREVHLTFDSGFQRELILTMSDHMTNRIIRGAQPELVRSYELWADENLIVAEEDNYLRKRVHNLDQPVSLTKLRLKVLSTHGAPEAHVFEVRLY